MSNSNRRSFLQSAVPLVVAGLSQQADAKQASAQEVEQWEAIELSFAGPSSGNPFLDVQFSVEFRRDYRKLTVAGFYDGEGVYRVRFMPDTVGEWTFTTHSNAPALNGKTERFHCTSPSTGNHGPVTIRNTHHFGYADGTAYYPFGTTCYAWTHQTPELEEQTLATLKNSPFNKIRMCVFPKWYAYNREEPPRYPFERTPAGENDFARFRPEFFRHLEQRIGDLKSLGIQADLILFHPYDKWGYAAMPAEVNERYLRYVIARLAAFRNVWWSLANEWDFVKTKTLADWDRLFHIVQESDPYQHLRSIHNGKVLYDHAKPWVTHASIQGDEFDKTQAWLTEYRKPVIFDECKYEGNIPRRWGDISAQEMVRRCWLATIAGAYTGHGETYLDAKEVLWWSKGGVLHGQSEERIAFLRRIVEADAGPGLTPLNNPYYPAAGRVGEYYLYYLDYHQPAEFEIDLPTPGHFQAELIDPWEMKITMLSSDVQGKAILKLPGRPYLAVRLRKKV